MLCLRKIFVFIPILSNVILFLQAAVCLQVQLHFWTWIFLCMCQLKENYEPLTLALIVASHLYAQYLPVHTATNSVEICGKDRFKGPSINDVPPLGVKGNLPKVMLIRMLI